MLTTDTDQAVLLSSHHKNDYAKHLVSLGDSYVKSSGIKSIRLDPKSSRYLHALFRKISENNELLLAKNKQPSFTIIKSNLPFHFSLPGHRFYFSSGLISNYFKHEELLVAVLTYEMIKSDHLIYRKQTRVPVGFIYTKQILELTRIPLKYKMEINHWAFFAMKRAGFDAFAYLNWLQAQNKNTLDFSLLLGSEQQISKEEFLFKKFIIQQGIQEKDIQILRSNSSPLFYHFVNTLKRKNHET
ncbi:MAG: hypothetical protein HN353_12830 [Bdellovibrionales bacterium]|jgi:hypothetical protein|nr:hypothetical protein [Bdellovibrionales bacterium]MBT3525323.1 hypothetical protein [Bdellovibrionales bacterium]MBT7669824.1 hypothetical protein [Bdellovibrionales bacterium]